MKIYKLVVMIISVLFLASGCFWRRASVSSTTFADSDKIPYGFSHQSSFCVLNTNSDNPLLSKEIRKKIEQLLTQKGFVIQDKNTANYYLVFETNIESSKHLVNNLHYIPGTTQNTQGNLGNLLFNQKTTSSGTFQYVPEEITIFTGSINIYVYDATEHRKWFGKEVLVWSGSAASSGDNPDLRELIDYLLVSIFKDFGLSSGKLITRTIWASETEELKKARLERTVKSKSILTTALKNTLD